MDGLAQKIMWRPIKVSIVQMLKLLLDNSQYLSMRSGDKTDCKVNIDTEFEDRHMEETAVIFLC